MEITPILILIYLIIKDLTILPRKLDSKSQIDRLEQRLIRLDDKLAAIKKESYANPPNQTTNKGWRRQGSEL
tara:strand:- start:199 stop:414 length:216 start_codon:yes stop_codon:yes gene_type:complete